MNSSKMQYHCGYADGLRAILLLNYLSRNQKKICDLYNNIFFNEVSSDAPESMRVQVSMLKIVELAHIALSESLPEGDYAVGYEDGWRDSPIVTFIHDNLDRIKTIWNTAYKAELVHTDPAKVLAGIKAVINQATLGLNAPSLRTSPAVELSP